MCTKELAHFNDFTLEFELIIVQNSLNSIRQLRFGQFGGFLSGTLHEKWDIFLTEGNVIEHLLSFFQI